MANWLVRRALHKKNIEEFPGIYLRQFLTLNDLFDDPKVDFINEKIHPIFYKGMCPIYVCEQKYIGHHPTYGPYRGSFGMCGFYCVYSQEGELTQDQFGFNPPNASPKPGSPIPQAVDWEPDNDDELMPYGGAEDKQPLTTLDQYPSSYLGKVVETGEGGISDNQLPFKPQATSPSTPLPNVGILKAAGYGSTDNSPNTVYKPSDGVKLEWKSLRVNSANNVDLKTFSKTLADKLNHDNADFGGLHPLQIKTPVFLTNLYDGTYSAVVFYCNSYAETAPNTFVVTDKDDPYYNKMILPYSAAYKNGGKESFGRWCWIQQSRLYKGKRGIDRIDHAFEGEKALINALEALPPAQQFLAQVSCTQAYDPLLFYLTYPLAYYEGYKPVSAEEVGNSKVEAATNDQKYIFLNLSGEDIDVYVEAGDSRSQDTQVSAGAIFTRNTYLTNDGGYKCPSNVTFKVTKKGDEDTVLGYYQAVDVPDLHDYHVTIIVEPKSD